jgi:diadenosine tetraphosphate (Ap4A) HIT family hydrolase
LVFLDIYLIFRKYGRCLKGSGQDMQGEGDDHCELCGSPGGELVWQDALCRVVSVADPDYPGFCRVILNRHEREMTDIPDAERQRVMRVVFAVEKALRKLYQPDKVNLASFGNMTPHVHWHVIPRWNNDRHFPHPVWGTAQRVNVPMRRVVGSHLLYREIVAALDAV